jgi:hypothetical protein
MAISVDSATGNIIAGGEQTDGDLILRANNGANRIHLDANGANVWVGGNNEEGNVLVFASGGDNSTSAQATIHLNGGNGNITAGGNQADGDLVLRANNGANRIHLDAGGANMWVGGNGEEGNALVFAAGGDNSTSAQATIHLNGGNGNITAGGNQTDGDLVLRANDGSNRIHLDATGANMWIGGNGEEGNVFVFASNGDNSTSSQATIHMNGATGDIILQNADCAEDFAIDDAECAEPGTVMVIGGQSQLRVSDAAYDRRVAGVVAGGGTCRPGIVLGRNDAVTDARPIALVGRTFCKVDAEYGAVDIGDLLTSSPTPGHAMKVGDPARAPGAVIGKALGTLPSGTGLIPILIALQ